MHPNAAACLGLTCKKLYPIFKTCYPKNLRLYVWKTKTRLQDPESPSFSPQLYVLLKDWMSRKMVLRSSGHEVLVLAENYTEDGN